MIEKNLQFIGVKHGDKGYMSYENKRKVYIVGMGPGDKLTVTAEAMKALDEAELLVGAERIVRIYEDYGSKKVFYSYKADEIKAYIDSHLEYQTVALLYSGDIGFYSGANNMLKLLDEVYEVCLVPGMSSIIYFMDKLGVTWEDTLMVSNHGRERKLIPLIRDNKKVCTLLGEDNQVARLAEKLCYYGMRKVKIAVGERLSYEDEKITIKSASELLDYKNNKLAVALIENNEFDNSIRTAGISDEEFIRGKVPMTKQEVRSISLAKLGLNKDSVLYDIGAGTGSVAIEAALLMPEGNVYAIEKNPEAVSLIEENKKKFIADNVEIIAGMAPEALKDLPMPTHAFIGGSSGNMEEIVKYLTLMNPDIRCVITAVTIETIAKLEELTKRFKECENMEILQISSARSKKAGSYHLMQAENPIYIASFGGHVVS